MMRHASKVVLAAVALSGCVPTTLTDSYAIWAQVVDAKTQKPIPGASFVLAGGHRDLPAVAKTTDANGIVHIAAVERRRWLPIYGDFIFPSSDRQVHIEAAGYRPVDLDARQAFASQDGQPGHDCYYYYLGTTVSLDMHCGLQLVFLEKLR
jgi:hypothetical protein